MQTTKTQKTKDASKVFLAKQDEKILVMKRDVLFPKGALSGLTTVNIVQYQKLIEKNGEFLWRSKMESDPSYKQIIPYLLFSHEEKFFLMQRKSSASEKRLQGKYTLGIGGHIRKEDLVKKDIASWAKREFTEEVSYQGGVKITPLGLLNDESNFVGQVHTGFVFWLQGDTPNISVKEELASGILLPLAQCAHFYHRMENWSKIVFDHLKKTAAKQ